MSIKKRGVVLTLWALVLPGVFLFFALLVQLSVEINRRQELYHLAYQAAQSGFLIVQSELQEVFEENKRRVCGVEFPPIICTSSSIESFVSDAEKAEIIRSTYLEVWSHVRKFVVENDSSSELIFSDIHMTYPYFPSDPLVFCALGMKLKIRENIFIVSFISF